MTIIARGLVSLGLVSTALACAPKSDDQATAAADTASIASAAQPEMASAMPPDQEFLRMMSDHHSGMILMVHEAMERKDKIASLADAKKIDQEQDDDLDRMRAALKGMNDDYKPAPSSDAQATANSMMKLSGPEFDRAFWQNTIKHHQMGIAMIDEYLPKLTRADVKTLAERMRAVQAGEITEMTKKSGGK